MQNIVRTAAAALVVLVNASASSSAAEDGNGTLLKGKAAFGSWQQDKLGISAKRVAVASAASGTIRPCRWYCAHHDRQGRKVVSLL